MNYTEQEIKQIQDVISGKIILTPGQRERGKKKFSTEEPPRHLGNAIVFAITNPDLYQKLLRDERTKEFGLFGFFPESFPLVYGNETSPSLELGSGNRGYTFLFRHHVKNLVIKPVQSSRESEIANIAAELGIGPKQYETLEYFLTEELPQGKPFSQLRNSEITPEKMYELGRRVATILNKLHSREIFYNDTTITDDMGRSHLMVAESDVKLFDYGVALRLNNFPNLSDEEVFNYARTLPGVNSSLALDQSLDKINALVEKFRPDVQGFSKQNIMMRDLELTLEGLHFATFRLGGHIFEPFRKGFNEIYNFNP